MLAWQRFSERRLAQRIGELAATHPQTLQRQLAYQLQLEQAVVAAAKKGTSRVPTAMLQAVTDDLTAELNQAGFSTAERAAVIQHHALMEWQLAQVRAQAAAPTPNDVDRWYQRHAAQCCRPEQRLTRHLLLTVEGNVEAMQTQILLLRQQLQVESEPFARLAERHSHCPTALEGGLLGWVSRGLLFVSLEQALFSLTEGELSAPVATELGWHLLLCEAIRPPSPLTKDEVLPKIHQQLLLQRQQALQRQWLADLVPRR